MASLGWKTGYPKKLRARVFKDTRPTVATLYDNLADGVHGSELFGD